MASSARRDPGWPSRIGVSLGRMYNAGRAVSLARWALETTADYAKKRKTFSNAIASYQAIQFMLADSAMEIYSAYTMAMDCARRIDRGEKVDKQLAMVKAHSCEVGFQILDRCVQIHGGMGLVNETRFHDGWHALRVARVADGTSEIMRRNVARAVLGGDLRI